MADDTNADKIQDLNGNWITEEELLKGKTEDQIKALKFIRSIGTSAGCFKTEFVTYEAFSEVLKNKIAKESINKEAALSHLGVDEDQVKEINPICFQYYVINDEKNLPRYIKYVKESDVYVSSIYQVTWLFFGSDQVYVHSKSFDVTSDATQSQTEEYFYKDIVSFSTENQSKQESILEETVEAGCGNKEVKRNYVSKMVKTASFKIGIPGEPFRCVYKEGDGIVTTNVNAMKQKLREKKQA